MADELTAPKILSEVIRNKHISPNADIDRDKMAQRVLAVDNIPLEQCRVWDARQTNLPGTSSSDDLGYITGTLGTDMPSIQTSDMKTLGAVTRYCGLTIKVPEDYEDGETLTIRLTAGMKTTVADVTATIDAQVYRNAGDGTVGSDICATAAQSINSLSATDNDFVITPATLVAGDILDVRIAIAVNDAASATAVIARLVSIKLLSDRR